LFCGGTLRSSVVGGKSDSEGPWELLGERPRAGSPTFLDILRRSWNRRKKVYAMMEKMEESVMENMNAKAKPISFWVVIRIATADADAWAYIRQLILFEKLKVLLAWEIVACAWAAKDAAVSAWFVNIWSMFYLETTNPGPKRQVSRHSQNLPELLLRHYLHCSLPTELQS